jgi:hypothetical protein
MSLAGWLAWAMVLYCTVYEAGGKGERGLPVVGERAHERMGKQMVGSGCGWLLGGLALVWMAGKGSESMSHVTHHVATPIDR